MNTHKILLKESMSDKRINFYNVHENKEKEILEYYKTLPDIKKKLEELEQKYSKKESFNLKKEIDKLKQEVKDIESNKALNEYHLKLSIYLEKYLNANKNKKIKKVKKGMNNYVTSEGIIDKNEILQRFQCSITDNIYVKNARETHIKDLLTCPECR